jgi:hypothetical protein
MTVPIAWDDKDPGRASSLQSLSSRRRYRARCPASEFLRSQFLRNRSEIVIVLELGSLLPPNPSVCTTSPVADITDRAR